jgi:hypothetical protein
MAGMARSGKVGSGEVGQVKRSGENSSVSNFAVMFVCDVPIDKRGFCLIRCTCEAWAAPASPTDDTTTQHTEANRRAALRTGRVLLGR